MKAYAQFYDKRNGEFVEAMGSFGLIALDARMNLTNMKDVSANHCKKRRYAAYQVFSGNLKTQRKLTPLIEV